MKKVWVLVLGVWVAGACIGVCENNKVLVIVNGTKLKVEGKLVERRTR